MKKRNKAERRAELRGLMQREVEKNLISEDELAQLAGSVSVSVSAKTQELTCKCWCATGLLSTCFHGTIDVEQPFDPVGVD